MGNILGYVLLIALWIIWVAVYEWLPGMRGILIIVTISVVAYTISKPATRGGP